MTSMQPEFKFYSVTVQIDQEDPETAKIKKTTNFYSQNIPNQRLPSFVYDMIYNLNLQSLWERV